MTLQQAHDRLDALQLVDVRETDELVLARLPGAIHIPMDQTPARVGELDRTTPVAVICRSGNRSAHVSEYLNQLGFTAHDVDGGLRQWVCAGLPLQT